jgi:hypothetical protein
LFIGTLADNNADRHRKGRTRNGEAPHIISLDDRVLNKVEEEMAMDAVRGIRDSDLGKKGAILAIVLCISSVPEVSAEGLWVCWPSLSTLSRWTSMSRSSVQIAIKEVVASGLVSIVSRHETCSTSLYYMDVAAIGRLWDRSKPGFPL